MALRNLRRELSAERAQQEERSSQEAEQARQRKREYAQAIRPALRVLGQLESRFLASARALAPLCEATVDSSNLPERNIVSKLLGRPSATDERPALSVALEPVSPEMGQHHSIKLEGRPDMLYFEAAYGLRTDEVDGVRGTRYAHVVHKDTYPIAEFSAPAGKQWLESQFEKYYREMAAWKQQFPELWNPRSGR